MKASEVFATPAGGTAGLQQMLKAWDSASRTTRTRILGVFLAQHSQSTAPALETFFSNGASLFLNRLSAHLRLTYLLDDPRSLRTQLQAIRAFVGAAGGQRFMVEFIEVGGALTVLEILTLDELDETVATLALQLLLEVADAGRRYKELLCESDAVVYVAGSLSRAASPETRLHCRNLLYQLALGNPAHHQQVVQQLIDLLRSSSPQEAAAPPEPEAQQLAAQVLRQLLPTSPEPPSLSMVAPVLGLFTSSELQVQYEASELVKVLMGYEELEGPLLQGLVGLLQGDYGSAGADDAGAEDAEAVQDVAASSERPAVTSASSRPRTTASTSARRTERWSGESSHHTQAAAARVLGLLAGKDTHLVRRIVQLQAVRWLLVAVGQVGSLDCQVQAALALQTLLVACPEAEQPLRDGVGELFLQRLLADPEGTCTSLTPLQADMLVTNNVVIELQGAAPGGAGGVFFGEDDSDDLDLAGRLSEQLSVKG